MMTKRLEGKVAVVTGSGQGVGRGIALVLAREGAKVVTNNRKPGSTGTASFKKELDEQFNDEERAKLLTLKGDAESTANEIIKEGGEAVPFYGDVSEFATAGKLIQTAVDTFGRVDILVNNAAGMGFGMLATTTEADWDYQTVPKLKGAFNCLSHALPFMREQKSGRILNVASDAWVGIAGLGAYSAANPGIVGLTKAAAKELWPFGITCNAFCPQAASRSHVNFRATLRELIKTQGITMEVDEAKMKEVEEAHGPAENMAPFVAYLATEEAAFISGAVFSITANGRVALYSDPEPAGEIKKNEGPWTVEELIKTVPENLLKDYVSIATRNEWA
ncbi:SDR family NAD(P)-dependent oxidoreductase [Paenibacillus sp. FSL R5-0527]|uniref:SDR family NAD(P)-dependent oxidoreductase n=1 Tax=Paenibacillus sp. FSL R5-0527 TaxID=2975321 RepID=UPI0026A82672